ncbi:MAG: hypothetical protein EXR50_06985 [Dehalococcoidia bacterium]|nr:hypothetical protein [Dehalococcoidia bacterium]
MEYFVSGRKQEPHGYQSPRYAPFGCYRCRGYEAWCVISCEAEAEWKALVNVMGGPAWADGEKFGSKAARIESRAELDRLISEWAEQYTPRQVMHFLQRAGVPAGMAQNAEDLSYDYYVRARSHIVSVDHPAPWGTSNYPESAA